MSSSRLARTFTGLSRGVIVLAVVGGAVSVLPAGPVGAQVRPLAAEGSVAFQVYLVLPANSGVSSSNTTTTEQLSAFSLATTTSGAGTGALGASAGKSTLPVVTVTMPIDVVSTELFRDAVAGTALDPVEVVFRRQVNGKQEPFLTYTFKNAVISSYQLQDAQSAATVLVTLGFQSITATFGTGASTSASGATGTVPTGWNITTNKAP
jgi:type VI protein secretion system component Hcp